MEKLYLSKDKFHFLESELHILGCIIDDEGIRMCPHKVDTVVNWKVPTNHDLLHGFLVHLLNQKNLSGQQAHRVEKISCFDFHVVYVPGKENVLADMLSRMHLADVLGTVCARSEYTYHDMVDDNSPVGAVTQTDMLILSSIKAVATVPHRQRQSMAPTETGRAETSCEFAACQHDNFVLCGPCK
ncbi:hypothetical protein HYPSUDRAFT_151492 [Hypholoma sublateritium FD-334 SS-4]|uniref:Reverse transcriptase RNase H-like domain-containing protein n=1 Tax=Hypholoma sublateritium (strain FD-334 SS-4) TaxID=945553 RepID=A0A0D2NAC0_HYPSF|nr:hypothetical protein HYPSUDRAFT_151492 [Hypholoma sublateritium FD-334 SS-4]